MPNLYDRRVGDEEFRQVVRKYAPKKFLPLVSAISSRYILPDQWSTSPYRKYTPWALAEIARTSLAYGNEHRTGSPDEAAVLRACAAYVALSDPDLSQGTSGAFWKFMARVSYEQLSFQKPVFNELGRSVALFEQFPPDRSFKVFADGWQEDAFSCSILEYVATGFLFHVGAAQNNGTFDLAWLEQENFSEVLKELDKDVIKQVAREQFIADVPQFRYLNDQVAAPAHRDLRRHTFNPLQSKPVIAGLVDILLIPSAAMLLRKVSPVGIFYSGMRRWGIQFANELGYIFEWYVGRQLKLISDATIAPTVEYDRDRKETVDWFAVFADVVLLIEVKSTRTTESIRMADSVAGDDIKRTLGKAVRQLETSESLIRDGEATLSHIPSDRPRIGLIVTMEPFYMLNSAALRSELPSISIPYLICSSSELEDIVSCTSASVGTVIHGHATDPSKDGWSVRAAFEGETREQNPILSNAWEQLPWNDSQPSAE